MSNRRNIVFGCSTCSAFFTDRANHLGDCIDINHRIHTDSPPRGINRILHTANNVYSVEQPDGPIAGIALDIGEQRNMRMRLASVHCSECQTECGWKILGVSRHPVLRSGQFILRARKYRESQTRRAPRQGRQGRQG